MHISRHLPPELVAKVASNLPLPDIEALHKAQIVGLSKDTLRVADPVAAKALEVRGHFYAWTRIVRDNADPFEREIYTLAREIATPESAAEMDQRLADLAEADRRLGRAPQSDPVRERLAEAIADYHEVQQAELPINRIYDTVHRYTPITAMSLMQRTEHLSINIDAAQLGVNAIMRMIERPQTSNHYRRKCIRKLSPQQAIDVLSQQPGRRYLNDFAYAASDANVRSRILACQDLSYHVLNTLAQQSKNAAERANIRERGASYRTVRVTLAKTAEDPQERLAIARNPQSFPAELAELANTSKAVTERQAIATNKRTTEMTLKLLATIATTRVERNALRSNPILPEIVWRAFAESPLNEAERVAMIDDPRTPDIALGELALHTENPEERDRILHHPRFGEGARHGLICTSMDATERGKLLNLSGELECDVPYPPDFYEHVGVSADPAEELRVAKAADAPRHLLLHLAQHASNRSLRRALRRSPQADDEILSHLVPFAHYPERRAIGEHAESGPATVRALYDAAVDDNERQLALQHFLAPIELHEVYGRAKRPRAGGMLNSDVLGVFADYQAQPPGSSS